MVWRNLGRNPDLPAHWATLILISWIQLMGHTSASRGVSGMDLVGCVTSLEPQGAIPPGLTLLGGVRFIAWRPFFRGMPTMPEALLGMPGAFEQQLCTRTHLKNSLVPHSSGWWDGRQILLMSQPMLHFMKLLISLRVLSMGLKNIPPNEAARNTNT